MIKIESAGEEKPKDCGSRSVSGGSQGERHQQLVKDDSVQKLTIAPMIGDYDEKDDRMQERGSVDDLESGNDY